MNRSSLFIFALVTACTFASSPIDGASTRENKRLQEGKITKNEAQHLVLKKFPGATVRKCELSRGKDHSVWILDVVKSGATEVTKVQVDGRSGKIAP